MRMNIFKRLSAVELLWIMELAKEGADLITKHRGSSKGKPQLEALSVFVTYLYSLIYGL